MLSCNGLNKGMVPQQLWIPPHYSILATFNNLKISSRLQKICLAIPKKICPTFPKNMADNPKQSTLRLSGIWTKTAKYVFGIKLKYEHIVLLLTPLKRYPLQSRITYEIINFISTLKYIYIHIMFQILLFLFSMFSW